MKKRIKWLDFAKGLTIFFVVFGHSLSTIYYTKHINPAFFVTLMSIIFTFIMPCFFAISGYFYKSIDKLKDYKTMIYKKIISLGIPYVLFSIIYVIMLHFGGNSVNTPINYHSLFKIYLEPISYLWFMYALFFMFVIVGFLDLINVNKYLQLCIYIFCTVISFIFYKDLWSGLQFTFNNILFFYIGYIISKNINKNYFNKIIQNKITTFILIFVCILLLIIQSFYEVGASNDGTNPMNILTKIISILLLFNISNVLPKNKFYNYFSKYGKFTVVIYLVHVPMVSTLRAISFKLIPINNVTSVFLSIFLVIIVWIASIFVCYLTQKYNFIYYIFYPRRILKKYKLYN